MENCRNFILNKKAVTTVFSSNLVTQAVNKSV